MALLTEIIDPRGVRAIRNEYDDDGRLTRTIDADGHAIEYTHDIEGRTERVKDRRGHATVFEYDDEGRVLSETNARNEVVRHSYDADGNETSRTDAEGHVTTWTYDPRGNALTEKNHLGETTTSTYDARNGLLTQHDARGVKVMENVYNHLNGALVSTKDALGHETTFGYDSGIGSQCSSGELLSLKDAANAETRYTIDGACRGWRMTETDALGQRTTFAHDAMGRVKTETKTRVVDGQTETLVTRYTYDEKGRVTKVEHPDGSFTTTEWNPIDKPAKRCRNGTECTTYTYNARGLLEETRNHDGTTERTVYDPNGNAVESVAIDGLTTKRVYDAVNRLIETIHPDETPDDQSDNPRSRRQYDKAGRLIAATDARGHTTRYEYDDADRQTKVIDPLGRTMEMRYDRAGRKIALIDAKGRTTKYIYNDAGQLVETIRPDETPGDDSDNARTRVELDALGRKAAELDEENRRGEFGYDALGRMTAVRQAVGSSLATTTSFTFNERGSRATQTDAEGRMTRWTYDSRQRLRSRTLPMEQIETFDYNALGHPSAHTDFNGKTTRYEYDAQDRLERIVFPDGATPRTFTYTADGKTEAVTDASGTMRYAYDGRNRLRRVLDAEGRAVEYTYDAAGNLVSRVSATQSLLYTHDVLNRITSVTAIRDGEPARTTRYEYDEVGNRTAMLHDDGSRTEYAHDVRNRLTNLTKRAGDGSLQFGIAYAMDRSGLRTRAVERDPQGIEREVTYSYDALERLAQEIVAARDPNLSRATAWTHDKVGNRLTQTMTPAGGAPIVTSYVYDANDRLTSETTAGQETRYSYDANGNLVRKTAPDGVTNYVFDVENRLIEATTPAATLRYGYNANGIRTKKSETTSSGTTVTEYLVDSSFASPQVLEEWRRENGGAPTLDAVYAYGTERISQTRGGVTSFFHLDGLGSTRLLADVAGNVTDRYAYTAFGELDEAASAKATSNDFLFAGEQWDDALDLYYNRARYLDPSVGRFVGMDRYSGVASEPITLNKFAYANANPVHYVDPSGYFGITETSGALNVLGTLMSSAIANPETAEITEFRDDKYRRHFGSEFIANSELAKHITVNGENVIINVAFRVGRSLNARAHARLRQVKDEIADYWGAERRMSPANRWWSVITNVTDYEWPGVWGAGVVTASSVEISANSYQNAGLLCRSGHSRSEQGHVDRRNEPSHIYLCANAESGYVGAHEFGHVLGFDDAYEGRGENVTSWPGHEDSDIMAAPPPVGERNDAAVQWYHIKILARGYGKGQR